MLSATAGNLLPLSSKCTLHWLFCNLYFSFSSWHLVKLCRQKALEEKGVSVPSSNVLLLEDSFGGNTYIVSRGQLCVTQPVNDFPQCSLGWSLQCSAPERQEAQQCRKPTASGTISEWLAQGTSLDGFAIVSEAWLLPLKPFLGWPLGSFKVGSKVSHLSTDGFLHTWKAHSQWVLLGKHLSKFFHHLVNCNFSNKVWISAQCGRGALSWMLYFRFRNSSCSLCLLFQYFLEVS